MKFRRLLQVISLLALSLPGYGAQTLVDASWQHAAPREEIAPQFALDSTGGRTGRAALVIETDEREGLNGQWFKTLPVKGGQFYRFSAWRKTERVGTPRRSTAARILWQDDEGKQVPDDGPAVANVLKGWKPQAEPEYPADRASDPEGWTQVGDVYRAPAAATQARIELQLHWETRAKVRWSEVTLEPNGASGLGPLPPERKVDEREP